jgi:hypothetical protein
MSASVRTEREWVSGRRLPFTAFAGFSARSPMSTRYWQKRRIAVRYVDTDT